MGTLRVKLTRAVSHGISGSTVSTSSTVATTATRRVHAVYASGDRPSIHASGYIVKKKKQHASSTKDSDSELWVLDSLGGRSFICSTHSTREPGGTHPPYLKKAITAPLRQGSQPKSCLTSVFLRHLRRDISDTPALSRGQMAQGFVLHLDSPRTFTMF